VIKKPISRGDETPSPDREIETADRERDRFRSADIVLVEIAKLQSDGDHLKTTMGEVRSDMREARDRMIRLEELIRGEVGTRIAHIDDSLTETKKKVDRIHNWVVGAAAVVTALVVIIQIALRFWPTK